MMFTAINQFMTMPTQAADINVLDFVKSKVPSTIPQ